MAAPKGNKYAEGNNGGRPRKFESPDKMQEAIEKYFEKCDSNTREIYVKSSGKIEKISSPLPYTVEGLCLVLDIDRTTLLEYEKDVNRKEFHGTVKNAKLRIQENTMQRALNGDNNNAVSIFVAKNNFGYKDKTEQEVTGKDGKDLFQSMNVRVIRTPEQADKIKNE